MQNLQILKLSNITIIGDYKISIVKTFISPTQRQKTSNPLTQNLTSNPQPKLYENTLNCLQTSAVDKFPRSGKFQLSIWMSNLRNGLK